LSSPWYTVDEKCSFGLKITFTNSLFNFFSML
jgi:hypothetical protein